MKIGNWIFGLLFLAAAILQWNDPDPLRWILIYLGAGIVSIAATHRPAIWKAAVLVAIVGAIWAATLLPEVADNFQFSNLVSTMKVESPEIEKSRELLGLLMIASWMIVVVFNCRPRQSTR